MRPLSTTLVLVVTIAFAAEAPCEEGAAPTPDPEAYERARQHFRQGVRLSEEEHWEEALALFDGSWGASPSSSTGRARRSAWTAT